MITRHIFNNISRFIINIMPFLMVLSFGFTFYYAIFSSPPDYQQQEFVRIMYIHVPSAWMSLGCYFLIGILSIGYILCKNLILETIARKSAIVGALFCMLTLVTGSLWGKPIWGAWWVWDARLTSMLILFFFYIAYIVLCKSIENNDKNSVAPSILAIVGMINVPIIKFSVNLWTTLHQPASIFKINGPTIHHSMMIPLILMFISCLLFFILIVTLRVKKDFLQKKILRISLR